MGQAAESLKDKGDSAFCMELEEYKKKKANILLPSTRIEGLSEWHKPVIDEVYLSINTDDGDIYCQEKSTFKDKPSKYALTAQALKKIGACAGVIWHPTECRRTDNRKDRDYVSFQAVGGVRKADGSAIFFKSEYDLDFEVIDDEIREQYRTKAKKYDKDNAGWWKKMSAEDKDEYLDRCARRDLLQKRKHKMKLAETGAMTRVIRSLLGLKSTYTLEELKKPFVMARIVIKPDYNNKEVQRAMIEASIKSITGVYGGVTEFPRAEQLNGQIIDIPGEEETYPEDAEPDDNNGEGGPEYPEPFDGDEKGDSDADSAKTDFLNQDADGQIETLGTLMERKGYDPEQLTKPLKDFTAKHREGFYDKLMEDPDSDDIPF